MLTTTQTTHGETYTKVPTGKIVLWISIVSMIMMFAGLTSGYIVRQAEGNWFVFELPSIFYISTVLIVISSISMHYALWSVKRNDFKGLRTGLFITLGLGLAFSFTQFAAWTKLVDMGIYFIGNPSGSFLYVISGVHLAHLVGGIIFLMVVSVGAIKGKYHSGSLLPVELCAIFWHFLDGLWVYLFFFLLFIR